MIVAYLLPKYLCCVCGEHRDKDKVDPVFSNTAAADAMTTYDRCHDCNEQLVWEE